MKNKKAKQKKTTIKVKLIIIPLIVVFLSMTAITITSSWFVRDSLLDQMKEDGLALANQVVEKVENNTLSLNTINAMLEDKIRVAGKTVRAYESALTNGLLKKIAEDSDVDELYWYTSDGEIIYSTIDEYLGWKPSAGHPVDNFRISGESERMEEIRKDSESDNYNKYGYLRNSDGSFIQVGIRANEVEALTQRFSYQTLVEELAKEKNIVYATIIDTDLKAIADSDIEDIGIVYDADEDKEMMQALNGTASETEWYYDKIDAKVLEITIPIFIDGKVEAALDIGISMENVYLAINRNMIMIIIAGIVAFFVLAFTLLRSSNYTIRIIGNLKEFLVRVASGDLTQNVSQDDLNKTDEFGDIAKAVDVMKKSIQDMIRNIADTSVTIASSSEQLSSTSEQAVSASNEIAKTIEEIAQGATDQAKETEQGSNSVNLLSNYIEKNQKMMIELNSALEQVEILKTEGVKALDILVEKTEQSKDASQNIYNVIIETNESAGIINNASQMIKNIADQTNLLALNAAIEAARAGEAGRGFAVVAEEIRKLAEQSNNFTDEISKIIKVLTGKTGVAVKTMEEVSQIVSQQTDSVEQTNIKFDRISNMIDSIMGILIKLNKSGTEMLKMKDDIITMVENLSAISQENAAATEEVAASVEEQTASMDEIANASDALAKLAEEMQRSVTKFKY